jgi:hypothetical protein
MKNQFKFYPSTSHGCSPEHLLNGSKTNSLFQKYLLRLSKHLKFSFKKPSFIAINNFN